MMENSFRRDAAAPLALTGGEARPRTPSFVDRIMDAVKRLPTPYWITYLAAFLLQAALSHALAWFVGWLPAFTLFPLLFLYPFWLWGPLALMTYLNATSVATLDSFHSLLEFHEEDLTRLKYEFVKMPARNVLLSSVCWTLLFIVVGYPVTMAWARTESVATPMALFVLLQGAIAFFVGSPIYYHSLRQLQLVSRTVKMAKEFDLFRLEPVYAFSRLTSRTGIAWIILFSFTMLAFPFELINVVAVFIYAAQLVFAVAAFVVPLRLVNQRLVAAKRKLIADLDQRFKSTLEDVHRSVDAREYGEFEQLEHTLSVLNGERDVLNKIPTLPWRAETVRGFLSAIAVPVLLLLVQIALERFVGG